jgi:hypothetical protein
MEALDVSLHTISELTRAVVARVTSGQADGSTSGWVARGDARSVPPVVKSLVKRKTWPAVRESQGPVGRPRGGFKIASGAPAQADHVSLSPGSSCNMHSLRGRLAASKEVPTAYVRPMKVA